MSKERKIDKERKNRIGKKLKDKILEKDYPTIENFAHSNDMHKDMLYRICNGTRDPRLSTIEKITRALGIKIDDLL